MNVLFDTTALYIFRFIGYRYFCAVPIAPPVPDSRGGFCGYLEVIPFKNNYEAYEYYLDHRNKNGAVPLKKEYVEELADGVSGLAVYIKSIENVIHND